MYAPLANRIMITCNTFHFYNIQYLCKHRVLKVRVYANAENQK